jgi:hypothetical protein
MEARKMTCFDSEIRAAFQIVSETELTPRGILAVEIGRFGPFAPYRGGENG